MTTPVLAQTEEPAAHQIRCAEVWGGTDCKDDLIETPGIRAAIHSTASGSSKGGDIYYFSVCAYDTLTRIAVADVRGHGEAVSHLSEWLYAALEARMNDDNGAAVLADLNELVRIRGFEAITTAAIATIHRDRQTLDYTYAGHHPILLGRLGKPWQPLEIAATGGPANLPLGALPGIRYHQERVTLEPGDRLTMFTDGILECPGQNDESYGDGTFQEMLHRTRPLSMRAAHKAVLGNLSRFANGQLTHDDCTLLTFEPKPPVPFWKRRLLPGSRR